MVSDTFRLALFNAIGVVTLGGAFADKLKETGVSKISSATRNILSSILEKPT